MIHKVLEMIILMQKYIHKIKGGVFRLFILPVKAFQGKRLIPFLT